MKKVLYAIIPMLLLAGIIWVLINNKAKSDAKAQVPPPKALSVSVAAVSRQTVTQDLALVGTITANREVLVASETQGRVRAVGVKIGDRIGVGGMIANVDDELKQAALANAQVNYDKAKADLDRYKLLQNESEGGVADIQVQTMYQTMKGAEAALIVARRQLRDTRITAPISGVVTARPVEIGSSLTSGAPVATIVDISILKVKINVPEEDVFKLHNGDRVVITTDVYPGVSFDGHVSMIGAKADEAHTYPVEVTVANSSQNPLRAGMFGRVDFTSIPHKSALLVPREALIGSVKKAQVYVVNNGVAKLRDIVVGSESGTSVEVISGLMEGDKVVVSGQNNLRDNVPVTVVSSKQ